MEYKPELHFQYDGWNKLGTSLVKKETILKSFKKCSDKILNHILLFKYLGTCLWNIIEKFTIWV